MKIVKLNTATVPDLFEKAPKLISPRVHAWLDVAVTSYFAALGAFFWANGKKRAASAAFLNAGMVAGVSLMTDYYGTGEKPISFKMHGTLDIVQAATAATAPLMMGFAGDREALFFYGQAADEVGVVALTDWDAGERDDAAIDYAA
jgi:hypothetical protein